VKDYRSKKVVIAFWCLFFLGAGLRGINVWRPVDRPSWRECDIAAIARNYYREGMNLFYPRIDWRGDGPGYAEMEFPLYPWLIAVLYKLFGFHEFLGRLLVFVFSLITLGLFFQLARSLLPPFGALAASLFFVLSPLVVGISHSLQPEGLMLLCYILAVYAFIRWLDDERSWHYYSLALGATALAILAKATAAHIGLFFAALVLGRMGVGALRRPRIWVFGVVSLLPALLWYAHARHFWLTYGNSLGVSNEYHWAGWDLFTNRSFILGIAGSEIFYVWIPTGVLVIAVGLFLKKSDRAIEYSLYWLASILVFYLIAARTTSASWAVYYHVISVPPVAILFGAGFDALLWLRLSRQLLILLIISLGIVTAALGLAGIPVLLEFHSKWLLKFSILCGMSGAILAAFYAYRTGTGHEKIGGAKSSLFNGLVVCLVAICAAATFLYQARQIIEDVRSWSMNEGLYACAKAFAPEVPDQVLIVASGGPCRGPTGYPVAYNSSYMFYWLDHKGFNICEEEQSVAALKALAQRGARYFIAEKYELGKKPGIEADLRKAFPVRRECKDALMFDLSVQ